MIEIVFSDSAAGSLKMAQSYGAGEFHSPAIGVVVHRSDGRKATKAEIKKAKREAQKREKTNWENAVPMGGKAEDVFSFSLAYSIGDISESGIGESRLHVLNDLFDLYPEEAGCSAAQEIYSKAVHNLKIVENRLSRGDAVRIWYGEQPDEMCGLYWFLAQLHQWNVPFEKVFVVKLADWKEKGNAVVIHTGWGEVEPGEWGTYVSLQRQASEAFLVCVAQRWKELQTENAALRAVINGRLCSVPEDFYDSFIWKEMNVMDNEFHEAALIGNVLGKYQLAISDCWIAKRIEKMLESGQLTAITEAQKDGPLYHRQLKKR